MVELLAVVATIAILASLLLPTISKAKSRAQRTTCFSNLKQLGLAWWLYQTDNGGVLVPSYPGNPSVWVQGDMTKASDASNEELIRQGKLYQSMSIDTKSTTIYRCPTDERRLIEGQSIQPVRSYSMNGFMGARDTSAGTIPSTADSYKVFTRESDLQHAVNLWVLVDEDERSINDGFFVTDPGGRIWFDFPAISAHRHDFSFALSFGDGHVAVWRHKEPRTFAVSSSGTEQSGNRDLKRLADASTFK